MKLETIITGTPITLEEILEARSRRAEKQKELLNRGGSCLISFSLNIPGEIKQFPMAMSAFNEGLTEIRKRLSGGQLLSFEEFAENTGSGAFFLLNADAAEIKATMAALEESHPLGRLFDIDVLAPDGLSLSRTTLGLPPRTCLICGGNAKACTRSRAHSMELILWRTAQLLNDYFRNKTADQAASCAVRALLYEVSATPKPGLVDRDNSGSHRDMDFFTFLDSSAALIPWFRDFFCTGWDHFDEPDEALFSRLRFSGKEAETGMFQATNGVNTHKGLVFSFAILCAALGKVHAGCYGLGCRAENPAAGEQLLEPVLNICRRLGACSLKDFTAPSVTAGEICHASYGIRGARGEAAEGFPSAVTLGLPSLKRWLQKGFSLNDAAVLTLLALLSSVDDTNMIHRGGRDLALECKKGAGRLLSGITKDNFKEKLKSLDAFYIRENLSPGGCADLLAVSLILYFLETDRLL